MRSEAKPKAARAKSARGAADTGATDRIDSPDGSCGSTEQPQRRVDSSRLAMKVFSATLARERAVLDEKITAWLRALPPGAEILDRWIRQSSDREFHCLSFTFLVLMP